MSSLYSLISWVCSISSMNVWLLEMTVSLVPGMSVVTINEYSVKAALIVLHHVRFVRPQVFDVVPKEQVAAGPFWLC